MRSADAAARLLAVGLLAALAGGCTKPGPAPPKTYPVKGKVARSDGTPFGPGAIEFRNLSGPYNAVGEVRADGTFTLSTLVGRDKLPGAVEGDCEVTVTPPQPADRATAKGPPAMPIKLPKRYTVKPQENDFTLTLPRRKR